jgi:hypothetical protein
MGKLMDAFLKKLASSNQINIYENLQWQCKYSYIPLPGFLFSVTKLLPPQCHWESYWLHLC